MRHKITEEQALIIAHAQYENFRIMQEKKGRRIATIEVWVRNRAAGIMYSGADEHEMNLLKESMSIEREKIVGSGAATDSADSTDETS